MEKVLIIDLTSEQVTTEPYSYDKNGVYGRGLIVDLFKRYLPDGTDRYDEENLIVIVPGLFAGNIAPSACRMLVATIEAKDRGIQISNTTGNMPQKLGSLGIAAIVIKGRSVRNDAVISISNEGVSFNYDGSLRGKKTSEIVKKIKSIHGNDAAVIGCGITGDMSMSLSTFFCTYPNGEPEYHCPRNGFGDVWGAKRLRAVVVESDSYFLRECKEPELFRDIGRDLARKIINDEVCGQALPSYGSITIMKILERQYSLEHLEVQKLEGKDLQGKKGNIKYNRTCAPMCVIGCLNRNTDSRGIRYASPSQIETHAMIEKCFRVDDHELAAAVQSGASEICIAAPEFVTSCKTFAVVNNIEHGEKHLIEWLDEVRKGSVTGMLIASRTHGISKLFADVDLKEWIDRKAEQDEEMFNVRMDTAFPGLTELSAIDLLYAQIFVLENLGFCIFTSFALLDNAETFEMLAKMFEARTGSKMSGEKLVEQAMCSIKDERDYREYRWMLAQKHNVPPFTKVLYRYFDSKG